MINQREEIQRKAKEAWLKSERRNSIILGTGAGKSKVCIDILNEVNPSSILLLTNSQNLRDKNWKEECEKWGYDWSKIQSETYQKMYKEIGAWDLIIYDEIDYCIGTPEYSKCFENLDCNMLLGLTGFITEEKEAILETIAPICYKVTTQELQQSAVLNKSEVVLIQYPISKVNDIKVPKKKGGFFNTSENNQYKYYDSLFQKAVIIKTSLDKKMRMGIKVDEKDYKSAEWTFKITATKRKSILNNLTSAVEVVKNLVEHIHSRPNNKILIFSANTNQADRFGVPTYHGKSIDVLGIDNLNVGTINTLATCKKINRGTNLIGVNYIIRESYDSSETDFSQSHGRLMRLEVDQVAKYIILIPYYDDLVKMEDGMFRRQLLPTQALKWVERMLESFDTDNIRTVKLGSDYKIPDGILI